MSETLPQSITRLADLVGTLNPRGSGRARPLVEVTLDFFGSSMAHLAAIIPSEYAQELVEAKCHHCEAMVTCARIVAPFVACQPCIDRIMEEERWGKLKGYWEHICPARFRDTDTDHPDFPKVIWQDIKKNDQPGLSYFLIGPSRKGKTRVGMELLWLRLMAEVPQRVGVLWPEKIAGLKSDFNDQGTFDRYAEFDVLLFDDVLLAACRNARHVESIKQLLDVRMRNNKPCIFTSQIGEAGILSGKEYGELKEADIARVDALVKRLREDCKVVSFDTAAPAPGETPF